MALLTSMVKTFARKWIIYVRLWACVLSKIFLWTSKDGIFILYFLFIAGYFYSLTVEEHLYFYGKLKGLSKSELKALTLV